MASQARIHAATLAAFGGIAGVVLLFWAYPKLLVYLLLIIVAIFGYGALYLILAARLDPEEEARDARSGLRPTFPPDVDDTLVDATRPAARVSTSATKKASGRAAKKPSGADKLSEPGPRRGKAPRKKKASTKTTKPSRAARHSEAKPKEQKPSKAKKSQVDTDDSGSAEAAKGRAERGAT